jgi:hypothetical protein
VYNTDTGRQAGEHATQLMGSTYHGVVSFHRPHSFTVALAYFVMEHYYSLKHELLDSRTLIAWYKTNLLY